MQDSGSSAWSVAKFPSRGMCREFLDQVRLWNRLEDLPRIETDPMADGVRVRFSSGEPGPLNLLRLIDSLGGRVTAGRRDAGALRA